MRGDKLLELSQAEARELKDLVEAELERRYVAIKDELDRHFAVVVGLDPVQAWANVRVLVDELVKSNLASLDKSLAIVLKVPPAEPVKVEAPPVDILEPEPEEPVEEPEPEKAKAE